ncbi:MAG: hypothetical protein F6J94_02525 [Moorea sp. SIO1F2]|uniref:hypothetical protein n=1 Tax=unclassified Moorena TaxID=2683338 RepID=UPI0013BD1465|nr:MULTISPECIES: hypothetical protein [unclassified Moorena]NEO21028.1 hypothetical protein [Moorena sp. SIO4A5]NET80889.1 hypothetical protein [Moorena sp. SIO1F2]
MRYTGFFARSAALDSRLPTPDSRLPTSINPERKYLTQLVTAITVLFTVDG